MVTKGDLLSRLLGDEVHRCAFGRPSGAAMYDQGPGVPLLTSRTLPFPSKAKCLGLVDSSARDALVYLTSRAQLGAVPAPSWEVVGCAWRPVRVRVQCLVTDFLRSVTPEGAAHSSSVEGCSLVENLASRFASWDQEARRLPRPCNPREVVGWLASVFDGGPGSAAPMRAPSESTPAAPSVPSMTPPSVTMPPSLSLRPRGSASVACSCTQWVIPSPGQHQQSTWRPGRASRLPSY